MYGLVTPVYNEEDFLPEVIEAVLDQTRTPAIWVVVDDGSTDSSAEIIKDAETNHNFVKYLYLDRGQHSHDTELGYASVVKHGMEYILESGAFLEFTGILDADILPSSEYFDELCRALLSNSGTGVVSGRLHTTKEIDYALSSPRGGARLYRTQFLIDIGGYPVTAAPDTVTDIKAENRGWETTKLRNVHAHQLRPSRTAKGIWHGQKSKGRGRYYLHYHPINALLTGLYHCTNKPRYQGLAYLYGYFSSYFIEYPRTDDQEVKKHFRNQITNLIPIDGK